MNIFEVVKDAFAPFMDGEKKPLHTGEVMNLWAYLASAEQAVRIEQIAYNTAQDQELKEKLQDLIETVHKPIIQEIQEFLQKEGIPLPPITPEKPIVENMQFQVPEWAKMTDEEIANFSAYKVVLGINNAARGISEAVRSDVGAMFGRFLMLKVTYALTLKRLMQERDWIRVPPYYHS